MYYPVERRITPLTTIRRERLLPARGQVLVQPGEVVGPVDVVARCMLPGRVRVVDVSRALGVRREQTAKYLRKAVGDTVQADEVLAASKGLLGRLRPGCRAPVDGQIFAVRDGLVLIEAVSETFELRAHIAGQITNVMPSVGVVISTSGALIQGTWGNGGETEGVLKVVVDKPQKPLRARAIDVSCHGTLVVGGRLLDQEVLEQAKEAKVRGVIVGSVDAAMRPFLESLSFPVMITEGFGSLPMAHNVFSLLHSNMGREAMLTADTQTRWGAERPEILIPLRTEEARLPEQPKLEPLQVGQKVRVARAPYMGTLGTVADLPVVPQTVESGARLPVAAVNLEDEETIVVPLANLELIH
jgi:uncharacterized membrane protein YvlD (DUF360 family)